MMRRATSARQGACDRWPEREEGLGWTSRFRSAFDAAEYQPRDAKEPANDRRAEEADQGEEKNTVVCSDVLATRRHANADHPSKQNGCNRPCTNAPPPLPTFMCPCPPLSLNELGRVLVTLMVFGLTKPFLDIIELGEVAHRDP
jgi:hypothetical protein